MYIFLISGNPVANKFFSYSDVILESSVDLSQHNNSPSVPPDSEINPKFKDTVSTIQTSTFSEKLTSSSEKLTDTSVKVQRPLLSPKPAAPAITLALTPRTIRFWDPYDIDSAPFLLAPPLLTETVARKKFKHGKSFDVTRCDKCSNSALQEKNNEPSTSAN